MCKKTTIFKTFKTAARLQWIDSNVKIIIAHTPNAFAPESRKKSRKKFVKKAQSKKLHLNDNAAATKNLCSTT